MTKNNKFDERILFVKNRLLLEEPEFSIEKGINEYIVITRAYEIDSREDSIKDAINYLIDRGNIEVVNIDEKGIRYIRWNTKKLT